MANMSRRHRSTTGRAGTPLTSSRASAGELRTKQSKMLRPISKARANLRRRRGSHLQLHNETQVGYCHLVTISTDNLIETNEFRTGVGADWTFLSDPGRIVRKVSTSRNTPARSTTR